MEAILPGIAVVAFIAVVYHILVPVFRKAPLPTHHLKPTSQPRPHSAA